MNFLFRFNHSICAIWARFFFFVSSCSYVLNSPAIWRYAVSHQHLFYIKPQINVCALVLCSVVGSHVISFYFPLVFVIFYAVYVVLILCIFSKRSGLSCSQSLWVKWRSLQKKLNQKQIHFVGWIKKSWGPMWFASLSFFFEIL